MNSASMHAASPVLVIPGVVPPTTDETQAISRTHPSTSSTVQAPVNRTRNTLTLATVPPPRFQNEVDSVHQFVGGCKALVNSQPLAPFTRIVSQVASFFGLGTGSSVVEADAPPSYDAVLAEDARVAKDGEPLPPH
ncbi:hypothetical protein FRB99_002526 [Tulasnella sp. 403]|nr:hypothetical protein FRB99_002526 [Tulasnella sp. 403]